eukprot:CAMPEP_0117423322 /NCGR_PEP_ID=MMETSP0758-20121206/3976_1 /TAXON_ID=63605 /ORGANISM="Percolomonas cosmopolitus, Strain AE-1 (ATCC 50343)" /LENGTH=365 /DNA_ID=CAMNT_0005206455 /DNA_START=11 /DNA_END=1108 /DNA_ORIENTATION=-
MKLLLAALLMALVVAAVYAHAPEDVVPGVIDVTESNHDDVMDGSKYTFAEFYAPWCGHCKNFAPEVAKLGETIEAMKPKDTQIVKVNCVDHASVCSKYGVQGYPTLKFFKKGSTTPEDYTSGRSAKDVLDFIANNGGARMHVYEPPSAVKVVTPENFDSVVGGDDNVLLEFYAPWCGHCKALTPKYEKVGETFARESNCVVAKVDADAHKSLGSKFDVKGFPTIKFFPKGSKEPVDYNGGREEQNFIDFLNDKCGTNRQLGGLPGRSAGIVATLNPLAREFVEANKSERQDLLKQAEEKASEVKLESLQKPAAYYVKVMNKIEAKGNDYPTTESARLNRIKENGQLSGDKLDYLQVRLNILSKFQ